MNKLVLLGSLILTIGTIGCQTSDRPPLVPRPSSAAALTTFSSTPDDSLTVRLLLQADSTFFLSISDEEASPTRSMQGRLSIAEDHYRLFFPDTVTQLNELMMPVHQDASVVVYPDHSVVLDRTLDQFYVHSTLVSKDTADQKK